MRNILDEIAAHTRKRVAAAKERVPIAQIRTRAENAAPVHDFIAALSHPGLSFICEIKKASPSKGLISPDFPYLDLARSYEIGGADAISCLTEPNWFLGSDEIFERVHKVTTLPMIRKDFTVDAYQIWEAKAMGASAILLICALLDEDTLREFLELTHSLGLAALVETHDESEIQQAVDVGARVIGVNNRNLKDFTVDFENAARLRDLIPEGVLYVAESGVSSPEDVAMLSELGADAVLMGEVLMRAESPKRLLHDMRKASRRRQ